MSAVWVSARAAVRVHRASMAGSALVVAGAAALLTATGVWLEAGMRGVAGTATAGTATSGLAGIDAGSMLVAVTSSFAGTAVLVALFVVSSTFATALRPRARELALMRAVGATTGQVRRLVRAEVLLVFALAAPLGVVPGLLLAGHLTGLFAGAGIVPAGFSVTLSPWPALAALALLLPTALGAARLAGRESARLDPAGAVRASAADPAGVSRVRATTAVVLAALGLGAAAMPFLVSGGGTSVAAGAAAGAIALVVAAALAGPVLVRWTALRALASPFTVPGSVRTLALLNARGFARRLTGAVVPMALLVALGMVQAGTGSVVAAGAQQQVRDGIDADLVVTSPDGAVTADQAAAVAHAPGVEQAATTAVVPATVRTDEEDEDVAFLDALNWEATGLRTVPAGGLLDPDVVRGSLDDLKGEHTIAISEDAALATAGIGDPVAVRVGGVEEELTVVAVYRRGLGFGDYLVGPGALDAGQAPSVLLVRSADPAAARAAAGAAGLTATDVDGYAAAVGQDVADQQRLSTVLMLALLALVAVLAASTLATVTRSRRGELALLHRTGATRRRLLAMVAFESVFTTAVAVVVGLACALPGLLGAAQGMLGRPLPPLDLPLLGGLVGVVVAIGTVVPLAAVARGARRGAALPV